jgi:hypothetical protein
MQNLQKQHHCQDDVQWIYCHFGCSAILLLHCPSRNSRVALLGVASNKPRRLSKQILYAIFCFSGGFVPHHPMGVLLFCRHFLATHIVQKAQKPLARFGPWLAPSLLFPWQARPLGVRPPRSPCGSGALHCKSNLLWCLGLVLIWLRTQLQNKSNSTQNQLNPAILRKIKPAFLQVFVFDMVDQYFAVLFTEDAS